MPGKDRSARHAIRPIIWVGSSKDDISALPAGVKTSFGLRLFELQQGQTPGDMKSLSQFGLGVYELRDNFDGNAFRLVIIVGLSTGIYVLHAFMKKSKSGIGMSQRDTRLIEGRLRRARVTDTGN